MSIELIESESLDKRMMDELFAGIAKAYELFIAVERDIEKQAVIAANAGREIGILLKQACRHEQVSFKFWQNHCKRLPFGFEAGRRFVGIADRMPEPATTFKGAVQMLFPSFYAAESLEEPKRDGMQNRLAIDQAEWLLASFSKMSVPYKKLIDERPMETWDRKALQRFKDETEWLGDARAKVDKLMEQA